jgi:hypothetical protein
VRYLVLPMLFVAHGAVAADAPQPPCSGAPLPAYAMVDARPSAQSSKNVTLNAPCAPAAEGTFEVAVALSGRFTENGGADRIVGRFGALSKMTAIQYYSHSHSDSRQMIERSTALRSPKPNDTRADFSPVELKSGADLYYAQSDPTTSGTVVYRMRVKSATADTLVVEVENVTPVKYLITLFEARGLRTVHVLRREADLAWSYYLLALAGGSHAESGRKSIENRALALYRYVAGQPIGSGEPLMRK